jgi:hypothetical protein
MFWRYRFIFTELIVPAKLRKYLSAVYMATTQYFLRILQQNNFIIARTISTFLMILNINNQTNVKS